MGYTNRNFLGERYTTTKEGLSVRPRITFYIYPGARRHGVMKPCYYSFVLVELGVGGTGPELALHSPFSGTEGFGEFVVMMRWTSVPKYLLMNRMGVGRSLGRALDRPKQGDVFPIEFINPAPLLSPEPNLSSGIICYPALRCYVHSPSSVSRKNQLIPAF